MPRPAGSQNKITRQIKEALAQLTIENIPNLSIWFRKVAEKDPAEALRLWFKVTAFVLPSANKMTDFQIAYPGHPVFREEQDEIIDQPEKIESPMTRAEAMDFLHDERVLSGVLTAMRDPKVPVEEALPIAEFLKDTHPHIHRQAMEIIDDKRFSATLEKSGNTPALPFCSPASSQSSPASSALRFNRAKWQKQLLYNGPHLFIAVPFKGRSHRARQGFTTKN
jgi:hypothetical protein